MTNVFTPLLFGAFERDRAEYAHQARRMVWFLVLLGTVVCGALFALARPIVEIILGSEFLEAIVVIRILSVATFIRFLNYGFTEILTTSRRQGRRLRLEALLLVVNVLANLALVPALGASGAAYACIVGEVALLIGVLWTLGRQGLDGQRVPSGTA
jgi:O-antigen/teichoic acid export membrane protein